MANQPKSYRKFVAGSVTAALVATAVSPVFAAEMTFKDEADFGSHKDNIYKAAADGLINGYTAGPNEGKFMPNDMLRRGQVVKTLARYLEKENGKTDVSKVEPFKDVPADYADQELYEASLVVKHYGAFQGVENNLLPNNNISRQAMAKVLVKAFDLKNDADKENKVEDLLTADEEFRPYIEILSKNEVTAVKEYNPKSHVSRAQYASFLVRAVEVAEATPEVPEAVSVSAVNGTLTVNFAELLESSPTAADFKVTRTINGGASETVTATLENYNALGKSATLSVPKVVANAQNQTVTYTVTFKDHKPATSQFTVSAAEQAAILGVGSDVGANQLTVIFSKPVDVATARTLMNYAYDTDTTDSNNALRYPTGVTLNNATVGPYGVNQVATLTFTAGDLVAGPNRSLSINNVKSANQQLIADTKMDLTVVATDSAAPTTVAANSELLNGNVRVQQNTITANSGQEITLNARLNDAAGNTVILGQYRIQRPDGTTTSWTNMDAVDGKYNEVSESVTAKINTTGFQTGLNTIQIRGIDAEGNVTGGAFAQTNSLAINIENSTDVAPPTVGAPAAVYNPAATNTAAANTVTVTGTATDNRGLVSKVEYRVRQYDPGAQTFTVTKDWTSVTAEDGSFDERIEDYRFTTSALTPGSSYQIEVRATDDSGNVAPAFAVNTAVMDAGGTAVYINDITAAQNIARSGNGDIAGDQPIFTVVRDDQDPTTGVVTSTPAATTRATATNRTSVVFTGTATDDYDVALDAAGVLSKVEYAVYEDTNRDGNYDSVVQNWTTNGVRANDGRFDSSSEGYTIQHNFADRNGDYRVLVRTVDTAGNVSATTSVDHFVDVTAPTASIIKDASVAAGDTFVVTFNETPLDTLGARAAADGTVSGDVFDADSFRIMNADGTLVPVGTNTATAITTGGNNAYVVTFTTAPTAGQKVLVTGVTDDAGNAMAATTLTIPNN